MGHALKVSETAQPVNSTEPRTRAVDGYISSIGSDLKSILQRGGAFSQWEVEAITSAVMKVLKDNRALAEEPLFNAMHANGLPKELSRTLAQVLSR